MKRLRFSSFFSCFMCTLLLCACVDEEKRGRRTRVGKVKKQATVTLLSKQIAQGEGLRLRAEAGEAILGLRLFVDDSLVSQIEGDTLFFEPKSRATGHRSAALSVHLADSSWEKHRISFLVLANSAPLAHDYWVQRRYAHNPEAYTQGLCLQGGVLYEGTGRKGQSYLQRRAWPSEQVLQTHHLAATLFGEGIAIHQRQLYQLTWRAHKGFIYEPSTLEKIGDFSYPTEGWGLTSWQNYLVMSDGSERLYFYRTNPWRHSHTLQVYDQKAPVLGINELESVGKHIYANQYEASQLLIIDPTSGALVGKVDLSTLFNTEAYADQTDEKIGVLNGIAHDPKTGHLLVTGKLWPYLFELSIRPQKAPPKHF